MLLPKKYIILLHIYDKFSKMGLFTLHSTQLLDLMLSGIFKVINWF